jgi:hypothetical protein
VNFNGEKKKTFNNRSMIFPDARRQAEEAKAAKIMRQSAIKSSFFELLSAINLATNENNPQRFYGF